MRGSRRQPSLAPFATGSLVLVAAIALMISFRLDGWGSPDLTLGPQLGLLPFTIIFLVLITLACLHPTELVPRERTGRTLLPVARLFVPWRQALATLPIVRIALAAVVFEQCMALALFAVEARYFRYLGYVGHGPLLLGVAALAALALGYAAFAPAPVQAPRLLMAASVVFVAGVVYAIVCFPLTPARSDMLPLIAAANARFLSGHDPYILYPIGDGFDYLTYLPLTWMVYLPASWLHWDLRWINVVLTLAAAALVYLSVSRQHRAQAACLLSVFLLLPYVQFRHELYASVQWLLMAAAFACFQRGRPNRAAIALGCGAAVSQLFWILIPFYLLLVVTRTGWRRAAQALLLILAAAAVWILPFLLRHPKAFYFCIIGHWGTAWAPGGPLPVRTYNATFWVRAALAHWHHESFRNLQRVQSAALVVLFLAAVRFRPRSQAHLWGWTGAAFTLFGLTNFAVWPYFYVTALFALLLRFLSSPCDDPREPRSIPGSEGAPFMTIALS